MLDWNIEGMPESSGLMGVIRLLMTAFFVAGYVMRGLGMYTLASRRQTGNAWFAWVPLLHHFLLGKLSDQYSGYVKGKNTRLRWLLLVLGIIWGIGMSVFLVLLMVLVGQMMLTVLTVGMILFSEEYSNSIQQVSDAMGWFPLVYYLTGIPLWVARYFALHNVYASSRPDRKNLWLVLSIFFRFTEPFFLFACRGSDRG